MAFDKPTRNRLAAFVAEARRLITDEFTRQFQSLYGIAETSLTELSQLSHLDDAGLAVAGLLRERIDYLVRTHPEDKAGLKTAVARLAREQAFTVLNRLAAVRMAEKRGLIIESVGSGYQSRGFKVFAQVARSGLGEIYQRYRRYLFCLFDELAVDLGVLFDRRSPQGLLFPGENTLLTLLDLLNGPELEPLWQEDETIGWIYQYYNDPAERKKMREESAAPRNSRELAVRNQFFTPRYVVEFLTDNTLGRIWYEMTRGETRLAEQCHYLVRRPTEIFLGPGETAPELPEQEGLSQEELLRQPVYVPHRALKDPRELRMLDPACGSMHFGLYAFDLYEVIYAEAWDRGMASLRTDFPERDALVRKIPRLIMEHNIHGIDIDPRAVQIAGLSLWLRAQRSWQEQRLPAGQRPRIRRANIVCAEPMPGDKAMLREFIASQFTPEEQPAFTFLLERVFDRMSLAGEAGSLLKIEEEISEAVREAKGLWQKGPQYTPGYLFAEAMPKQPEQLRLNLSGIADEGFWETAEGRIYAALRTYAEQAESGGYQRRLFAEDAARGFAFIDLCRKHYDAVVMNPPFGDVSTSARSYIHREFPNTKRDLGFSFIDRFRTVASLAGQIVSRTSWFLSSFEDWRKTLTKNGSVTAAADLGFGVLDSAMVETIAFVYANNDDLSNSVVIRLLDTQDPESGLLLSCQDVHNSKESFETFVCDFKRFLDIPGTCFSYWAPLEHLMLLSKKNHIHPNNAQIHWGLFSADDFRFLRTWFEVPFDSLNKSWVAYAKGGDYAEYFTPITLVINWQHEGYEIRENKDVDGKARSRIPNPEWYFKAGLTYSSVTVKGMAVRVMPEGSIFSIKGPGIIPNTRKRVDALCGFLNSSLSRQLMLYQTPSRSWDVPLVRRLPSIDEIPEEVDDASRELIQIKQTLAVHDELSRNYVAMCLSNCISIKSLLQIWSRNCSELFKRVDTLQRAINRTVDSYFRTVSSDLSEENVLDTQNVGEKLGDGAVGHNEILITDVLSFIFGFIFGRWDIRYATGERPAPEMPDPFAPLPICPPGILQGDDGLPLNPEAGRQLRAAGHYPLDIAWGGILVDDPGHPLDLDHRLREVFTVLWGDRAEAIEQEACEILGVKSLRDYFRKPSGFFADHLKRYSKSRRQAPIYWPLSTAKGSYTLWVYYHRLSDQTLHTALADFVDPKIKDIRAEISLLRESNNNRSRLEELLDLEGELLDFRTEIERIIKLPWQPNLNDGVLITAAPLWPLFRLPKWRKDLKACWDKLEKGDFDWAHLAYTIWPKRVEEVCKTDRSIAIAHGLEHLCQVEPPKPKAKRGRKKKAE